MTDKITVLLFSSGGFRVGAWDYSCWEDLVPVGEPPEGAALRMYRGYPEEYWTFVTPEAYGAVRLYREEWKHRFGREPRGSDPLLVSVRRAEPARLQREGQGVKAGRARRPPPARGQAQEARGEPRPRVPQVLQHHAEARQGGHLDKGAVGGHIPFIRDFGV